MHSENDPADYFHTLDDGTSFKTLLALMLVATIVSIAVGDPVVLIVGWIVVAVPLTAALALLRYAWNRRRHSPAPAARSRL